MNNDELPTFQQTAASYNQEPGVVPMFFLHEGIECVKVMKAGDTRTVSVFPADSMWTANDYGEPITYRERWQAQYDQFKSGTTQRADGTPLSDAPFLDPNRIRDLNQMKVFTLESLASFNDQHISRLGGNGYRLKTLAQEFLEKRQAPALNDSVVQALTTQNEALAARLAALEAKDTDEQSDEYEGFADDDLRDELERITGKRPHGKTARKTLVMMMQQAKEEAAA